MFSFLSFDVFNLNMSISCNNNGTICKRFSSNISNDTNTIADFIIGSIACLIFVVGIVMLMYMLCCKKYFRNKIQFRFRLHSASNNQEQSTDINRNQQQSSSSSQEANIDNNVSLNKKFWLIQFINYISIFIYFFCYGVLYTVLNLYFFYFVS